MRQNPPEYFTRKELLKLAKERGFTIPERRFIHWQRERLLPRGELLSGYGNVGYYKRDVLARLLFVAQSRKSLRQLRMPDRRPAKEVIAVQDGGFTEVLEVVGYQEGPNGRMLRVLRDGSLLDIKK